MQSPADSNNASPGTDAGVEAVHSLMRFVLWLLRGEGDGCAPLPVRVYYKFDSGGWRSRSTRQLHKVNRCR